MALLLQGDREAFFATSNQALALGGDRHLEAELGYQFVWAGRHEFGAALLKKAIDLNPAAAEPYWHQALSEHYFLEGNYLAALAEYQRGAQPQHWWSVSLEVAYLVKLGRMSEAIAARDRLFVLRPNIEIADIVWVYRRFQRPDPLMVEFVSAWREAGIPEGRYRPLETGESN
jgi:tetratricopeptide (TPR) repeat protein